MDNTVDTFGFGVIQNNIALKLFNRIIFSFGGFGVIQHNIALKLGKRYMPLKHEFWSHTKQHSSKT